MVNISVFVAWECVTEYIMNHTFTYPGINNGNSIYLVLLVISPSYSSVPHRVKEKTFKSIGNRKIVCCFSMLALGYCIVVVHFSPTMTFCYIRIFVVGLRMLDGASNQIHSIPDELGDLSRLEQLYLRYNKISHLPTLTRCTALKV